MNLRALWKPALLLAVAANVRCAVFPSNGAAQYTKLSFTVKLNAALNTADPYIYAVVINLAPGLNAPPNPQPGTGMAPVLQTGSITGMYTGLATDVLLIQTLQNTAAPVSIYDYGATAVDIGAVPPPPSSGTTNDQLTPLDTSGDLSNELTFTVFLNQLQTANPQSFQWIQFQVVTMNKPALGTVSGRFMDALGQSPNFTASPWLRIGTSVTDGMSTVCPGGVTGDTTPPGGDQALSIQSVSLQIQVP